VEGSKANPTTDSACLSATMTIGAGIAPSRGRDINALGINAQGALGFSF